MIGYKGRMKSCVNCDDWIQRKDEILLPGWRLFDENGDLRQDVENRQKEA
jgi:hypothetical protein